MYVNYSIIEFVIFIVQFVEILFIFQGGRLCCVREIFYLYNKLVDTETIICIEYKCKIRYVR